MIIPNDMNRPSRIKLHPSAPEFSSVIWGSMRMESQFSSTRELEDHLAWLYEQGVTTLDTASVYGAPHPFAVEELLGQAVAKVGKQKFEIVSKCGIRRVSKYRPENRIRHFDFSPEEIRASTDSSLSKLGVDSIDLMLLHRPDYLMEPDAVVGTLEDLVSEGKIRHIGVSNFSPSRFDLLNSKLRIPIVTNQIEFSPLHHQPISDGTFDMAIREGHRPMIWSPVGGGRLLESDDEGIVALRKTLTDVANAYGLAGPAEAAIAFTVRHPAGGVPIIGSGKRDRIEAAIQAANTRLDKQDWYAIVASTCPSLGL